MRVENLQKLLDQVQEIDEKGRKAVKATVSGVVVDGAGYGSAIVKNVASVPVTVHR